MKSRRTRQKELLAKEVQNIPGFFTAEELFRKIREQDVGIATVYRFLNEKIRQRQLHSYVCDKHTVYSNNSSSHCHYICQVCGKKQHIIIKDIGSIRKDIKGTICHFQIDVHGICAECLKKR